MSTKFYLIRLDIDQVKNLREIYMLKEIYKIIRTILADSFIHSIGIC